MEKIIKTVFVLLFPLLISSCGSSKKEDASVSVPDGLDTIIMNSQKNFELTTQMNKQSDSMVSSKVDNTVKKITKMEGEIKQLKQENNELKDKLDDANDDGKPFSIKSISNN